MHEVYEISIQGVPSSNEPLPGFQMWNSIIYKTTVNILRSPVSRERAISVLLCMKGPNKSIYEEFGFLRWRLINPLAQKNEQKLVAC